MTIWMVVMPVYSIPVVMQFLVKIKDKVRQNFDCDHSLLSGSTSKYTTKDSVLFCVVDIILMKNVYNYSYDLRDQGVQNLQWVYVCLNLCTPLVSSATVLCHWHIQGVIKGNVPKYKGTTLSKTLDTLTVTSLSYCTANF